MERRRRRRSVKAEKRVGERLLTAETRVPLLNAEKRVRDGQTLFHTSFGLSYLIAHVKRDL